MHSRPVTRGANRFGWSLLLYLLLLWAGSWLCL